MAEAPSFDEQMMHRAMQLAKKGRIIAPPNPWVGCVIVKDGNVIGEGYTHPAGQAHAEINALKQVKEHAKGSIVYVTLEPCSHFGRTPPCTKALIKAEVARVVIGIRDPDSKVHGNGIAELKNAGIEVVEGVASDLIEESLAPYLHHRRTGRPYCWAKAAVSIDGRVAAADSTSQWITSEEAQHDSHQLRAESQAILIGAGTASIDQPSLTIRYSALVPPSPPLRVVLDARGRVPAHGPLFDPFQAPTLMITSKQCPENVQNLWRQKGAEVVIVNNSLHHQGVDLGEVLDLLGARNILQILIEGGGTLLGSFLKDRLIQRVSLYIGPRILGSNGIPLFNDTSITTLKEAPILAFLGSKNLGNSMRLDYSFEEFYANLL